MPSAQPPDVVSATTVIDAPAEVIFRIVADPHQHARIDGSGSVRKATSGPRELRLGDRFGMDMKMGAPYKMRNEVVEYDKDRLLAWRTVGAHRWRYELEPLAEHGTRVTETWDASRYPAPGRWFLRTIGFPGRNLRSIEKTLVRLKEAAEQDAGTASA
jgi:uncharacterized protein YndB with AHSA1/START domain